jgi:type I restriction enzyme S subunit
MTVQIKAGYKQTEVGVIPEDWKLVRLSSLLAAPPSYGINAPAVPYSFSLPAYIRITDISDDGKFIEKSRASVDNKASYLYKLEEGDLVFARTGASVGKSYLYQKNDGDLVYAGFLIKIKPDEKKLNSIYLFNFVKSGFYWGWVKTNSMRSGQPGINGAEYGSLPVVIPSSVEEQKNIAEALSDADALIESLEQLIAKKRQIKQGAMQELLTGQRRLPGFSGKWKVQRLGSVLNFQVGFPFQSEYFNEKNIGIRLIKNRDLKSDDQIYFYSGKYLNEFLVKNGDVLIGMDGDFIPCLWKKGDALLNQRVGRVVTSPLINNIYAFYRIAAPLKYIEELTSSTTVKHLSHRDVEKIEIPLPELDEQIAIANVINDLEIQIEEIEANLTKARQIKQGMMQELLTGRIRLV